MVQKYNEDIIVLIALGRTVSCYSGVCLNMIITLEV